MKTTIVYYSLSGNVRFAAEAAAKELGAQLLALEPDKVYPEKGIRKLLAGGKSAVMGDTPPLKPYSFRPEECDRVLLATPIWAGRITPPLKSFLTEQKEALQGKRIAALFCCSGGSTSKAAEQIRELLGLPALEAELTLVNPMTKPAEEKQHALSAFCRKLAE